MLSISDGQAVSQKIPLARGDVVGERFVVERMVGAGGMGAVYRAHDLELGGYVALKVITTRHATELRFAREAQVLAGFSHPAIVRYLTHGVSQTGSAYLAMEWLDGEDLAERLSRGGLTVAESLALTCRLCLGLASAHEAGVVHRDIKPSNIFLVERTAERAKVLDFGVAHDGAATRRITRAGTVLGTIGYMAPEQAMGLPDIDARADVFALGCVLFECLTGCAAFTGQHDIAVLAKVLRDEPPRVSELRPGLGSALDALVGRLLAKDREQRPPDAATVLAELERLGELHGSAPLTVARKRRPRIQSEQRIVSVVLAQPTDLRAKTLPLEESEDELKLLDELAWQFGAEPVPLRLGQMLFVLSATHGVTASDRAAQAARCALRLREHRPSLAIAVATGTLDESDRVPVGVAIDRAAERLTSRVGGGVALDEVTAGLLGSRFDVQRNEDAFVLNGEDEQLEEPRLLLGRRTPLVGRDKELALLEATLEECVSDEVARAVLLTAPPGVGKSRLGHEYVERTRTKGAARILIARAEPNSMGSTLRVIRRLLRSAVGLQDGDPLPAQQRRLREYLSALVPAADQVRLTEFLGELVGVSVDVPSPLLHAARNDPEVLREQMRRAFGAWVDAESARRPLVLLVDDLHWADPASVGYLEDLLRLWPKRRILVLALARPEVHERFPKLWQASGFNEMRMQGLTSRAGERLVRAVLGPMQLASADRIIELADGNAFYLEELIRCAAEGRTDFPETVLAMVQSRIEALDAEERRILRAASVLGETFWSGYVDSVLGTAGSSEWLDSLVQLEILIPRAQARFHEEREYAFRHAFLRDAAYAMLPPSDKVLAHRLAGEWLESVAETDSLLLAEHYERGHVFDRAVEYIAKAALTAVDAGDIESARALSERGLALGAVGVHRGMLLLIDEYMAAWGRESDAERLREAIDLLPTASAHWWLGIATSIFSASAKGNAETATPYLELALGTDPGTELTGFRGLALQSLASGTILMGRPDIGWSLLERFESVRPSDPLFGARLQIARAHLAAYSPVNGKWQLQLALDWARESTAILDAAGSASGEMTAVFILGTTWLFLGAYEQAESTLQQSLAHAQHKGNLLVEQYSRLLLSWVHVRRGRPRDARQLLDSLSETWDLNIQHGASAVRAEAELAEGWHDAALERAVQATLGPAIPYRRMAWATVARTRLLCGDAVGALQAAEAARNDGNAFANLEFEIDLQTSHAQAQRARGDARAADESLRAALTFLEAVARGIPDDALRHVFLHDVPAHAHLRRLTLEAGWPPSLWEGCRRA